MTKHWFTDGHRTAIICIHENGEDVTKGYFKSDILGMTRDGYYRISDVEKCAEIAKLSENCVVVWVDDILESGMSRNGIKESVDERFDRVVGRG